MIPDNGFMQSCSSRLRSLPCQTLLQALKFAPTKHLLGAERCDSNPSISHASEALQAWQNGAGEGLMHLSACIYLVPLSFEKGRRRCFFCV
jgi:hypothetical protein